MSDHVAPKPGRSGPPPNLELIEQIRVLVAAGRSQNQISRETGKAQGYIHRLIHRYGMREKYANFKIDLDLLREMADAGLTQAEMAREIGVTDAAVHRAIQVHDIEVVKNPTREQRLRRMLSPAFIAEGRPVFAFPIGTEIRDLDAVDPIRIKAATQVDTGHVIIAGPLAAWRIRQAVEASWSDAS